jgi:hypothetical protein
MAVDVLNVLLSISRKNFYTCPVCIWEANYQDSAAMNIEMRRDIQARNLDKFKIYLQ